MNRCGTCKHYTGAGDWDLCCMVSARRLCYAKDEACEKYEQNPIKHRYYIVMDGQVIAIYNDTDGLHPVNVISIMGRELSERMEKANKDTWPEALEEARGEIE